MFIIVFFVYDDETGKTVSVPVDETEFNNQEELEFIYDDAVRKIWHAQQEEWYFSIVDVCQILADLQDYQHARNYWKVLKNRLLKEGNEPVTNCNQFKLKASDGKMRLTDCANTEQLLRIIQSIPSKKAEPFKQWLALVGKERLDEMADPELALQRGVAYYQAKGYSDAWITQRLRTIEMRKELTDEWKARGIDKEKDYAILTNEMTKAWSGLSVKDYKELKEQITSRKELNRVIKSLRRATHENLKATKVFDSGEEISKWEFSEINKARRRAFRNLNLEKEVILQGRESIGMGDERLSEIRAIEESFNKLNEKVMKKRRKMNKSSIEQNDDKNVAPLH